MARLGRPAGFRYLGRGARAARLVAYCQASARGGLRFATTGGGRERTWGSEKLDAEKVFQSIDNLIFSPAGRQGTGTWGTVRELLG